MRILVATDAWRPQVNGVVRSLESVAKALREFGAEIEFLTPQGFASIPLADLWRNQARLGDSPRAVSKRLEGSYDRPYSYRDRRPGRLCRAPLLLARETLLHDELSHALSGIYSARPDYPGIGLTYALLRHFHNAGSGIMVSTASIANRSAEARFQAFDALVARRRSRAVQPERRQRSSTCRGRSFFMPDDSPPEKNIEAFLSLDLPGSKVVAGDGPSAPGLASALSRTPISSARKRATHLRCSTPRRMSSCFRAAPTRSAWCCSKRSPADCRSRPFRSRVRSMSSARAAPACSTTDLAGRLPRRARHPAREGGAGACADLHLGEQRPAVPRQYPLRSRRGRARRRRIGGAARNEPVVRR